MHQPEHKRLINNHEIEKKTDDTNYKSNGLSRGAWEGAARYASNNRIQGDDSAENRFPMLEKEVLTRKDPPNPEKLKEIREKRRNEASAVKQTLEDNSRDMSEERTEYRIDLEKHPIQKEYLSRIANNYYGDAILPPDIQTKVDEKAGEEFSTREIHHHFHNIDWQFEHNWKGRISDIASEIDQKTALSELQETGKVLHKYGEMREHIVKILKSANNLSHLKKAEILALQPIGYLILRKRTHKMKGLAERWLIALEEWLNTWFPNANQDRSKPTTQGIHKKDLKKEFAELTASIDRNSEIQQDQKS